MAIDGATKLQSQDTEVEKSFLRANSYPQRRRKVGLVLDDGTYTHASVNNKTIERVKHTRGRAFAPQWHSPVDTGFLLDKFVREVEG